MLPGRRTLKKGTSATDRVFGALKGVGWFGRGIRKEISSKGAGLDKKGTAKLDRQCRRTVQWVVSRGGKEMFSGRGILGGKDYPRE